MIDGYGIGGATAFYAMTLRKPSQPTAVTARVCTSGNKSLIVSRVGQLPNECASSRERLRGLCRRSASTRPHMEEQNALKTVTWLRAILSQCQDLGAVFGHEDLMLELGRQRSVFGQDRPPI